MKSFFTKSQSELALKENRKATRWTRRKKAPKLTKHIRVEAKLLRELKEQAFKEKKTMTRIADILIREGLRVRKLDSSLVITGRKEGFGELPKRTDFGYL